MKFLIIDESKSNKGKNKEHLIECGLIIKGESLFEFERQIIRLKEKYNLDNLKELRGGVDKQKKLEITRQIAKLLIEFDIKVLAIYYGKNALNGTRKIEDNYFPALTFLLERFFLNLKRDNRHGFVIHDNIDKETEHCLRKSFYYYINNENLIMRSKIVGPFKDRIYPSLFFTKDDYCELLQVVDLISTSINDAIQKTRKVEQLWQYNDYLKEYWTILDKGPGGEVSGWGIKLWY